MFYMESTQTANQIFADLKIILSDLRSGPETSSIAIVFATTAPRMLSIYIIKWIHSAIFFTRLYMKRTRRKPRLKTTIGESDTVLLHVGFEPTKLGTVEIGMF